MWKDFLKKASDKTKEYSKKTVDYVKSDEFKDKVNTIKKQTVDATNGMVDKGKQMVEAQKNKKAEAKTADETEVVTETAETEVVAEKDDKK